MAETLTYQCPNCSAGLIFKPDKNKFCCEFCLSEFTEGELKNTEEEREAEDAASAEKEAAATAADVPDEEFCAQINQYACSTCGATLLCDDNTAATECPYCHNPVLLAGRLSGQMKPQKVIPFNFSKEEAEKKFLGFVSKKWFVPDDFKSVKHAEQICGVYYPFWVTDADTGASMTARATRVRHWRRGEYRYTETSNFHIVREGEIHFEDIVTPALKEEDKKMLNGILPYPSDAMREFSMPYLSGFVAKKRDIEKESVRSAVDARMQEYTQKMLRDTIEHYTTVYCNQPRLLVHDMHWDYTLMPIFVLTYRRRRKTFTYAMNGNTGKVYGELPVSGRKLGILGGAIGVAVAALVTLLMLL